MVILLGTNDTKAWNWVHRADFMRDTRELVESFENFPDHARVFLYRLPPVFPPGNYGIDPVHLRAELSDFDRVGAREKITVIDVNTPFLSRPDLFPEHVHPNDAGAAIIAKIVAHALTGRTF